MSTKNPLRTTWDIFSIVVTVISLSSFADSYVLWADFIVKIIASYQSLIYPIWNFLFSWLPFEIPDWLKDYLTIGIICSLSWYKGALVEGDFFTDLGSRLASVAFSPIWPIMIIGHIAYITDNKEEEKQERYEAIKTLRWLGVSFILFFSLLIANVLLRN
jgi:hypothetical protein